jgi:thiol-disulfide isomerase/thioredoxin
MTAARRDFAVIALGIWLAASPSARAEGRPAEEILRDYRAVAYPKRDPARKDAMSIQEYRRAYNKAEARKSELALELFRAHPEHEQVPDLLRARWIITMMDASTAGATILEIDRAMPLFKDPKRAREAAYLKAIATIRANRDTPEFARPAVDAFIRSDPKDPRSATLLSGFAGEVKDVALRVKLLERLIADYPDNPASRSAAATLELLRNVGKPLDLKFTDAIKGTLISIEGLKGKVVVLDFWATWCGPCVAEMPRMKRLYSRYKGQGVEFIGVSLDFPKEEGGLDKLKEFVARNEIAWPQFYQGHGWESEFSTKLGITSIPQLFLVDADGRLASIDARETLETLIPEYIDRAKTAKGSR